MDRVKNRPHRETTPQGNTPDDVMRARRGTQQAREAWLAEAKVDKTIDGEGGRATRRGRGYRDTSWFSRRLGTSHVNCNNLVSNM